ncbi:GOLPH3/VPS74 family protein [Nocardioides iriomotensis]|uniref:GPP34 family phosphoprotein n=1 Tax=Nocardioides iriomotensis TaxID=715784 RepID=A0A4Q5IXF1_9ACTN|nr:GPP34 family phosphoprotein [Nocardioides iriomotensis]RYU10840.1 GPP34 family phosphoprotein [Nocardioides iriomotensis]
MLLAEDLLLLLTDDDSGRLLVTAAEADVALGGARLIELTLAGRVDVTGEGEGRKGRLVVRSSERLGDPVLDDALGICVAYEGKKPQAVVGPLGKKLREALYDRLVEQGVLRAERGKVLGIFPTSRWPAADAAHERQVRQALEQALLTGLPPQDRTAALVSLLLALRSVHKVVPPKQHGLARRELERRAKQIAEGDWGSAAVRKAVDAMAAATMAAVTAATSAAVVGGSS